MKRACEPVHIQLNLDDSSVALVNRTYIKRPDLHYDVRVVGMTGSQLFEKQGQASLDTTAVREVLSLKSVLQGATGVSFVLLDLKDNKGVSVSQNVYWMSPAHDFLALRQMPSSRVQTKVLASGKKDGFTTWTLEMSNVSSQLAFFLNPQVVKDGEEVLPSYWSDNYFSIPAGQKVTVRVSCPTPLSGGSKIRLEGWNIPASTQPL